MTIEGRKLMFEQKPPRCMSTWRPAEPTRRPDVAKISIKAVA